MKFPTIVGAALLLASATVTCRTVHSQEEGEANITGIVTSAFSFDHARIHGAQVQISGQGHTYRTQTEPNGEYQISVRPGTYEIRVSLPGFCQGRRAAFRIKAGQKVQFDFDLFVCGSINTVQVGPPLEPQVTVRPTFRDRYQQEELPEIAHGIRPLVLFGESEDGVSFVRYSALVLLDRHFPVVYSYDLLTIKADAVIYSKKDSSIRGVGNVVLQNGTNTTHGSKIDLTFPDGEPHVDLAP